MVDRMPQPRERRSDRDESTAVTGLRRRVGVIAQTLRDVILAESAVELRVAPPERSPDSRGGWAEPS
jgi:hypothetical protein